MKEQKLKQKAEVIPVRSLDEPIGTGPQTLHSGSNYLEVVDYKNGRTYVSEKDNSQLISYGYGKWTGEEYVRLTIVQPKTKPPIRYVDMTGVELEAAAKKLAAAAELTDDPNAPLISGPWCDESWCEHRPNCKEYNKVADDIMVNSAIQSHFSKLVDNVEEMTNTEIVEILDAESIVQSLFDKAREEAQNRLNDQKVLNGYAMKPGRKGNKKWTDEEGLKKYLKRKKVKVSEMNETKLKSPAKIEALSQVDAKELEKFYEQPEGALKLTKVKRVKF
jgi:hypothetical protein